MGVHECFEQQSDRYGEFGDWRDYNLEGYDFESIALPNRPHKDGSGIIALFKSASNDLRYIDYPDLVTADRHLKADLVKTGKVTKKSIANGSFLYDENIKDLPEFKTYMKIRKALSAANGQRNHRPYHNCTPMG